MDTSHACCMWYLLVATPFHNDGSCPDGGKYVCSKPHLVTLFLFNSLGWRGKIEEFSYPALSRPVTWPWLGCAPPAVVVGGMRWRALPTECTYVWGLVGGTKGVLRIVREFTGPLEWGFWPKAPWEERNRTWVNDSVISHFLYVAFSVLPWFSSPWQLGEKEEHGSFKWTW